MVSGTGRGQECSLGGNRCDVCLLLTLLREPPCPHICDDLEDLLTGGDGVGERTE